MKQILVFILTLNIAAALSGETPHPVSSANSSGDMNSQYQQFLSNCLSANRAFINGQYETAIKLYTLCMNLRNQNSVLKKMTKRSGGWKLWLQLVKKRKNLGSITPEATHRIHVLLIKNMDLNFLDLSGARVKQKATLDLTMIPFIKQRHHLVKRMIETLSNGKMTLSFRYTMLNSTLKKVNISSFEEGSFQRELRYPIYDSIEPFNTFRETITHSLKETDTYILYWPGQGVATVAGGGSKSFPLIPYQLYTSAKGWISYPVDFKYTGYTPDKDWEALGLLHEFFHVLQTLTMKYSSYQIKHIHEWIPQKRHLIPEWNGRSEMEYYIWRFENTLSKIGYENLNNGFRYQNVISSRTIQNNEQAVMNISQMNLLKAQEIFRTADINNENALLAVLKLNPYHSDALLAMVNLYMKQNKNTDALPLINRAVELNLDNDYVYLLQARVLTNLKKYELSINAYSNAIRLNPGYDFYYYWRALLYFNLNKPNAVIHDLSIFIEKTKTFSWAYYNRGAAYALLKKYNNAESDYTRAIELEKNHLFYFQRGITRVYYLNDKQNGIEDLKTARKLGNRDAQEYINRISR